MARAQRRCVVVTLTLSRSADGLTIVGTNLAGKVVCTVMVSVEDTFGDVEDELRDQFALEHGAVLCFATSDAKLIGFSLRAKSIGELFLQAS